MKEKRTPDDPFAEFVAHPRYGRGPRRTGMQDPVEQFGGAHFNRHSPGESRISGTAIVANLARQCPATIAVTHYFDVQRTCLDCRRPFLFFAAEQKYWYEDLGFGLNSDCVRCAVCRKQAQSTARTRRRYEVLCHMAPRTAEQNLEMAACGLVLIASGVFPPRQTEKVRMLLRRVPDGTGNGPRWRELVARLHEFEPGSRDKARKPEDDASTV